MATIKAVIRKSKQKSDGTFPLYIRISEDNKNKYLTVGWSVLEKDWDAKSQRVKKGDPQYNMINSLIIKKVGEANQMVLEATNKSENNAPILEIIQKKKEIHNQSYFFAVAAEYLKDLEQNRKYTRLSSEKPRVKHFKKFLKNRDIPFRDITVPLLKKFMIFLKTEQELGDRSIMNTMVVIRTIYNVAISRRLADKNDYPFGKNGIRIKYPESIKTGLNEHEIHLLENVDLSKSPLANHARNVWLFSFYLAGMRISDVVRLRWNDVVDDRLNYEMGKNKKIVSLKLPAKAAAILEFYKGDRDENKGYVFPEMRKTDPDDARAVYNTISLATKKFNDQLKAIATDLKIRKKLTCHISRHSFGHITGDKISPQMLQKLYRHTSIQTTMGYQANFIHKDVDEALESVLNF